MASALDNALIQDSVRAVVTRGFRAVLMLALLGGIVLSACSRLSAGTGQASSLRSPSQIPSPSQTAVVSSSRSPAPAITPGPTASPTQNNCGAVGPCPPENGPAQVFDPVRREILSFGGWDYPNGQLKVFDTTWRYKDGRWAQLHPVHVPPARDTADIVFDAKNGVVVMYGGRDVPQAVAAGRGGEVGQITYSADTWTWNGSDWTQLSPAHFPVFFVPDIAFDAVRQNVVLLGSVGHMETWTWDGVDWTPQVRSDGLPQPVVRQTRLSYDPATRKVMCFGGRNDTGETLSNPWVWDGTTWSKLAGVTAPNIYYFGPTVSEGTGNTLLIFDWQTHTTWRWNGSSFARLSPAHEPAIAPEVVAADPENRVILGGLSQLDGSYELWQWTGSDWTPAAL